MNPIDELEQRCPDIEEKLGYKFKDRNLLLNAFVHRSFFNEQRELVKQHNERLEFLGDTVLGLIVSDFLYQELPSHPEGELSHLRAQLVEASACAEYVQKLDLGKFILLGRGERMNEGKGRETILSDLFEALMGALYLDGGLEAARLFFVKSFAQDLMHSVKEPLRNWKAELQDYSQKRYQRPPVYKVVGETGPDHSKVFEVAAYIGEQLVGEGKGSSKKEAEQSAAENALKKMSQ
ncbi:MAG: ribonuclease III [Chlamydiales bacterium]|nr:ribonuclease III [Chlamydiales bacterium]